MHADERSGAGVNLAAIMAELERNASEGQVGTRSLPPVDRWNPPYCGEAGIEIRRDGSWWHEGTRMTRERLVRLFASVLRRDEDGHHYLVTPAERIRITVEDAPFLAIRVDRRIGESGPVLVFTTDMGDLVAAGPDHPIRVETDPATGEPRPYVRVRGRLEARILRAPFYELVDHASVQDGHWVVESCGTAFVLGEAA
jgi:hypothetical protein